MHAHTTCTATMFIRVSGVRIFASLITSGCHNFGCDEDLVWRRS